MVLGSTGSTVSEACSGYGGNQGRCNWGGDACDAAAQYCWIYTGSFRANRDALGLCGRLTNFSTNLLLIP